MPGGKRPADTPKVIGAVPVAVKVTGVIGVPTTPFREWRIGTGDGRRNRLLVIIAAGEQSGSECREGDGGPGVECAHEYPLNAAASRRLMSFTGRYAAKSWMDARRMW